ncbi:hypothetical protein MKEN_01273500 [Mycena kentingensis (nom. inval.)]|nr:hypothetical protein MKEN_01273500 [Mycena kentingensis (nom. inval.)]
MFYARPQQKPLSVLQTFFALLSIVCIIVLSAFTIGHTLHIPRPWIFQTIFGKLLIFSAVVVLPRALSPTDADADTIASLQAVLLGCSLVISLYDITNATASQWMGSMILTGQFACDVLAFLVSVRASPHRREEHTDKALC